MSADVFFDTNVLLYLLDADLRKAETAQRLLAGGGAISVQVLNEFANVVRRKRALNWDELEQTLGVMKEVCDVHPVTVATHERGLSLARRHKLPIYDALDRRRGGDRGRDNALVRGHAGWRNARRRHDPQSLPDLTRVNPYSPSTPRSAPWSQRWRGKAPAAARRGRPRP